MILDWRQRWGSTAFPFLIVQLANFLEEHPQPTNSQWALLREAQADVLAVENTALICAIDVGEWNDIHPLNKQAVGERLALAADALAYNNRQTVYSGPVYESHQVDGQDIIVSFSHLGKGLLTKDGAAILTGFAVAGEDRQFHWANAKIEGDKVRLHCEKVLRPLAVRYAWADNPGYLNFVNSAGLPAVPFRTDEW